MVKQRQEIITKPSTRLLYRKLSRHNLSNSRSSISNNAKNIFNKELDKIGKHSKKHLCTDNEAPNVKHNLRRRMMPSIAKNFGNGDKKTVGEDLQTLMVDNLKGLLVKWVDEYAFDRNDANGNNLTLHVTNDDIDKDSSATFTLDNVNETGNENVICKTKEPRISIPFSSKRAKMISTLSLPKNRARNVTYKIRRCKVQKSNRILIDVRDCSLIVIKERRQSKLVFKNGRKFIRRRYKRKTLSKVPKNYKLCNASSMLKVPSVLKDIYTDPKDEKENDLFKAIKVGNRVMADDIQFTNSLEVQCNLLTVDNKYLNANTVEIQQVTDNAKISTSVKTRKRKRRRNRSPNCKWMKQKRGISNNSSKDESLTDHFKKIVDILNHENKSLKMDLKINVFTAKEAKDNETKLKHQLKEEDIKIVNHCETNNQSKQTKLTEGITELKELITDLNKVVEKFLLEHLNSFKAKDVESNNYIRRDDHALKFDKISTGVQPSNTVRFESFTNVPKNLRLNKKSVSYEVIDSESVIKITDMTSKIRVDKKVTNTATTCMPQSRSLYEIPINAKDNFITEVYKMQFNHPLYGPACLGGIPDRNSFPKGKTAAEYNNAFHKSFQCYNVVPEYSRTPNIRTRTTNSFVVVNIEKDKGTKCGGCRKWSSLFIIVCFLIFVGVLSYFYYNKYFKNNAKTRKITLQDLGF